MGPVGGRAAAALGLASLLLGSAESSEIESVPADYLDSFLPLPARFDTLVNPATAAKIALGRMLFFDPRLSRNDRLSCHGCHDLGAGFGADGRMVSLGHVGQPGRRNAPEPALGLDPRDPAIHVFLPTSSSC